MTVLELDFEGVEDELILELAAREGRLLLSHDVNTMTAAFQRPYISADGHAAATRAAEGWAMSKGEVSLALSGTGRGVSIGFSFGGFTIQPR